MRSFPRSILFLCLMFLVACVPTTTISTPVPSATHTPTLSPSNTPNPTATPSPTASKTPSPTPTLFPRKQVLIEARLQFGDGVPSERIYLGSFFILYTDGELLIMSNSSDSWYSQTALTTLQMCELLSSIEKTGFFKVKGDGSLRERDPIYSLLPTPRAGEGIMGAGGWSITINGKPAKHIFVYDPYQKYLIQEIKSVYSLLSQYKPPKQMKPYRAKYLWLSVFRQMGFYSPTPDPSLTWPSNLLPPEEILAGTDFQSLIIEDKNVSPILNIFSAEPKSFLFAYSGKEYVIRATPLLPHQPKDEPVKLPQEFDLPFKCP